MLGRFTPRFSYANVMSTLALFVALGGVSYAATSLPANSVGTMQLRANAVNSFKVANRSLRAVDFAVGQLPAGPAGSPGPAGPQGSAGAKGDPGANGTNGATKVVVRSASFAGGPGQVNCNAGERATGGGVTGANYTYYVRENEPTPNSGTPTGWAGSVLSTVTSTYGGGTVYVVCVSP